MNKSNRLNGGEEVKSSADIFQELVAMLGLRFSYMFSQPIYSGTDSFDIITIRKKSDDSFEMRKKRRMANFRMFLFRSGHASSSIDSSGLPMLDRSCSMSLTASSFIKLFLRYSMGDLSTMVEVDSKYRRLHSLSRSKIQSLIWLFDDIRECVFCFDGVRFLSLLRWRDSRNRHSHQ